MDKCLFCYVIKGEFCIAKGLDDGLQGFDCSTACFWAQLRAFESRLDVDGSRKCGELYERQDVRVG